MPAIPPAPIAVKTSGMAIAGFVVSFFCGLVGLVLSIVAYVECRKGRGRIQGEGLALAGIIVSVVSTAIVVYCWWAFTRFVDDVKHTIDRPDARLHLERMASEAKAYYYENGRFPIASAPLTPADACCESASERCSTNDWSAKGWRDLGFEIFGSTPYQFSFSSDANHFTATAVGDVECDGHPTTFRLTMDSDTLMSHIEEE